MKLDNRYMVYRPGGPLAGKRLYGLVGDVADDLDYSGTEAVFVYLRNYIIAEWNGGKLTVKALCPKTITRALERKRCEYLRTAGRRYCYRLVASGKVTPLLLDDLGFQSEPECHSAIYQSRAKGTTVEVYETKQDVGILFRSPSPSRTGSVIERWRFDGIKADKADIQPSGL